MAEMLNPAMQQMLDQATAELHKVQAELAHLREQKATVADAIRLKVAEEREVQSTVNRLTPRAPRTKKAAKAETASTESEES